MTISATSAASAAASTAQSGATGQLTADFSMFLKLLTTQMQHQDPLNPMDTAQYTQQLVQYSQVEQSIKQNSTLTDILARLSSQDLVQSSALIGREARFDSAQAPLADGHARWAWTSAKALTSLEATVTDATGAVVATQALSPAEAGIFAWDGTLQSGEAAMDGVYTLTLKGEDGSGNPVSLAAQGLAVVDGVTMTKGVTTLTSGQASYPAAAIVALHNSQEN